MKVLEIASLQKEPTNTFYTSANHTIFSIWLKPLFEYILYSLLECDLYFEILSSNSGSVGIILLKLYINYI